MKAEKQTGGGVIKRKGIILLSIIILLIITIAVGISYAYWQKTVIQTSKNNLTSDCFKLEYSDEDDIKLLNVYSISNNEGEKLKPYKVTLKNICENETKYQLNLEVLQSENRLKSEYVTLKVNNEENKILNEYEKTTGIIKDKEEAYKIYEGHLRKDQVINFEIRMWMGEEVELSDEVVNKTFKSKVTVEAVVENTAGIYKEEILNGADPVLKDGLIPVIINEEDGSVTRADTNKKWYNYANQEWANAVILEDNYEDPGAGQPIPEDQIESYFVWIPRYKYKIWDEGKYNSLTKLENKAQTIQVVFETKDKEASQGYTINSWLTHPAFTAFDVNGLWVGKFETGYKSANTTAAAQVNPNDEEEAKTKVSEVIIKPNAYSWRNIQVAKAYTISYNYERNLDSHMMKNTEWGAVAYLSQSIYGSRKNPRINNNQSFLTGYAAIDEPTCYAEQSSDCNKYGTSEKDSDSDYSYNYFNKSSIVASTTGNYTGIYDMSGGAEEYMMSATADGTDSNKLSAGRHDKWNSGFNGKLTCPGCKDVSVQSDPNIKEVTGGIDLPTEAKYYDIYEYSAAGNDYTRRILGDATGEMGPFQSIKYNDTITVTISSWYTNTATFIVSGAPYVLRSGLYSDGINAGFFNFDIHLGNANPNLGYRIVLAI